MTDEEKRMPHEFKEALLDGIFSARLYKGLSPSEMAYLSVQDVKMGSGAAETTEDPASRLASAILDAMENNLPRGITRSQLMDVINLHGGVNKDNNDLGAIDKYANDVRRRRFKDKMGFMKPEGENS